MKLLKCVPMSARIFFGRTSFFDKGKKKMKPIHAIIAILLTASAALANEETTSSWNCKPISDWEISQVVLSDKIIINNFLFKEKSSLLADTLRVVELSYSITNRSMRNIAFNSQVVGLNSDGEPTFALAVNPLFDLLSTETTETLSGDSYFKNTSSVLDESVIICFNFLSDIE